MQDFIRIGGEIVSQPLNENFRRLINAISMANTNLIFSEEYGIVDTINDMYNVPSPYDGQACYVVSSGELYRYTKLGNGKWVKIADFGQTFRQGFLNSGVVVMTAPMEKTESHTIVVPEALLYYKNKDGDNRYLRGMYRVPTSTLDASSFDSPGVYSIFASMEEERVEPEYIIDAGMPTEDEVEKIYMGSFLVDSTDDIMEDFVFTIPDIAYTADRGLFYISGGEADGLNLVPGNDNNATVNRKSGYYYDEGINYPESPIEEYPANVDNGSNYNLKFYEEEMSIAELYYLIPQGGLSKDITVSDSGLLVNKYWDESERLLKDVDEGHFTIQQHFVTPNGQNIILYGTKVYNSMQDAISNINSVFGSDVVFPYVEATRMVVGNFPSFNSGNSEHARFFTMGRLSQVGTISPIFADNQFVLYNGVSTDTTPAAMQFNLDVMGEDYDIEHLGYYKLNVLPYEVDRKLFSLPKKYITDSSTPDEDQILEDERKYPGPGYDLADNKDLDYLESRVSNIEAEIWSLYDAQKARYEQGIRKRLYDAEGRLDADDVILADHETRITSNEQNKVNKTTTINGKTLGDTTNKNEAKTIVLTTKDIDEPASATEADHWWFTQARVSANSDVIAAKAHADTVSGGTAASGHTIVNPHNLATDDLRLLTDTDRLFVDRGEKARVNSSKLPDDTKAELNDLDTRKIEYIPVSKLGGSQASPTGTETSLGNIKYIKIYEDGCGMTVAGSGNEKTLTLNIRGQRDGLMEQNRYATLELEYPSLYGGYIDNAVNAEFAYNVHGIESATANQYYGTNSNSVVGIYDLPTYVSSVDQSSFASEDQIIFVPVDGSVTETHLTTALKDKINNNYHKVYDGGTLSSSEINTFKFGNNLTVSVSGHEATINATGSGGQSVTEFANLDDVSVVYTGNAGKILAVNTNEDGIELATMPPLTAYMRKDVYVYPQDTTKVRKAVAADTAAVATNASALDNKVVDDTDNTTASLWTAAQIISDVSSQISTEGVNTYSGTSAPSNDLGKNGDLYILIES